MHHFILEYSPKELSFPSFGSVLFQNWLYMTLLAPYANHDAKHGRTFITTAQYPCAVCKRKRGSCQEMDTIADWQQIVKFCGKSELHLSNKGANLCCL